MIGRIVQDKRHQAARARARMKPAAAALRPPGQRRIPRHRIGVKNIEGRIRNRTFKIKKLLAQPKNVDVKKRGFDLRKMVVRRKTIFPAEVGRASY